jgi:hypothetical protein
MERDENKLEVVLECMALDDPRSPRDYIESLMTWSLKDLVEYLDRRKRQVGSMPKSPFRPHP